MMTNYTARLLAVFYLFITMTISQARAEQYRRRIIMHSHDIDPLQNLNDSQVAQAAAHVILAGEMLTWTAANLTDAQAALVTGVIQDDEEIQLPAFEDEIIILDDPISPYNDTDTQFSQESDLNILTDRPECNADVDNVHVVVIDSVFKNSVWLNNRGKKLISYVGDEDCASHGGYVASIIGGVNGMITSGNMKLLSAGVFNCAGKAWGSDVISAVGEAIKYERQVRSQGIRVIINYSGGGGINLLSDQAFKEAEQSGIAVFVAAGNAARDCMLISPARAAASSTVSSIGGTLGYIPAPITNYESAVPGNQCITKNLPAYVTSMDPRTGVVRRVYGTSFSSPLEAARGAIAWSQKLDASPAELKATLHKGVITVAVPADSHFSGVWDLLEKSYACPVVTDTQLLFTGTLTLTQNDSGKLINWYNATNTDKAFCVTFFANTNGAALLIGARSDNNDFDIKAVIGRPRAHNTPNRRWLHILRDQQKVIQRTFTPNRVIKGNSNFRKFTTQVQNNEFLVKYTQKDKQVIILQGAVDEQMQEIAFGTTAGRIKIKNARRCS